VHGLLSQMRFANPTARHSEKNKRIAVPESVENITEGCLAAALRRNVDRQSAFTKKAGIKLTIKRAVFTSHIHTSISSPSTTQHRRRERMKRVSYTTSRRSGKLVRKTRMQFHLFYHRISAGTRLTGSKTLSRSFSITGYMAILNDGKLVVASISKVKERFAHEQP